MTDAKIANAALPDDASRRRLLVTASATNAGTAFVPLLMGAAAQMAPNAAGPMPTLAGSDKARDLATETSVYTGQLLTTNIGMKTSDSVC